MATAKSVKDVSPHEFVKAYSAHLKRSGKQNGVTIELLVLDIWLLEIVMISLCLFFITDHCIFLALKSKPWVYSGLDQCVMSSREAYLLPVSVVDLAKQFVQCTNTDMISLIEWFLLLHIMAASMARKIYLRQGLGVGSFQRIYGGSKRNGSRPSHFCKSSGAVARHILQQLQKINIIDVEAKGGRRITSSGQRDLDQVAGQIVVAS
ncbi:hypothetical protein C3L33_18762, partial [Rhododendron williamsianum]